MHIDRQIDRDTDLQKNRKNSRDVKITQLYRERHTNTQIYRQTDRLLIRQIDDKQIDEKQIDK